MKFIFLACAILFNIIANIGMKVAAIQAIDFSGSFLDIARRNWVLIGSLILYALNALFYFLALRGLPLSIVYPVIVSTGFVFINIYAYFSLKEPITAWQIVGYALILIGIFFVFLMGAKPQQ